MSNSTWLQTYTGKKYNFLDPKPDMICIEDIAHSLSQICRFRGHTKEFYSVAQHSILVSNRLSDIDNRLVLSGLLHDAAEAYIGDMSAPIKRNDSFFQELENKTMAVIAECFNLDFPFHSDVARADIEALAIESESARIMGGQIEDWDLGCIVPSVRFDPWPSKIAENLFLANYEALKR